MMRTMLKIAPLVICLIGLAGCSKPFGKENYLHDKAGDYTKARITEPLKIPASFKDAKPLDNQWVIPKIVQADKPLPAHFEVPRPNPRLTGQDGVETYILEQTNDDVWLQAAQTPSQIEEILEHFFRINKIPLSKQSAQQQIIATQWVNFDDQDSDYSDILRGLGKVVGIKGLDPIESMFLIEVKAGAKPGTSKVYIKHKGRPLVSSGKAPSPVPAKWNNLGERSLQMDRALASDMLVFFGKHQDDDSITYKEQQIDISKDVKLTQDGNGNPLLIIKGISYARGWSAVGAALDAAGVHIDDRNRSTGIYYLSSDAGSAAKPQETPGFFARLFGSDKKAKKTAGQESLLLRVSQFSGFVQLSVEKDVANSADEKTSETLLNLIKDNLK
ncbi:MAG: outer membrane protein assembly factor BamC [Endozoicomonas sp. (ex Botrylloides leachii)]|nr:outer membrane protein assembly factor BamC [Endozoicomonas sp. (ex Botrylloides leachii)]